MDGRLWWNQNDTAARRDVTSHVKWVYVLWVTFWGFGSNVWIPNSVMRQTCSSLTRDVCVCQVFSLTHTQAHTHTHMQTESRQRCRKWLSVFYFVNMLMFRWPIKVQVCGIQMHRQVVACWSHTHAHAHTEMHIMYRRKKSTSTPFWPRHECFKPLNTHIHTVSHLLFREIRSNHKEMPLGHTTHIP